MTRTANINLLLHKNSPCDIYSSIIRLVLKTININFISKTYILKNTLRLYSKYITMQYRSHKFRHTDVIQTLFIVILMYDYIQICNLF